MKNFLREIARSARFSLSATIALTQFSTLWLPTRAAAAPPPRPITLEMKLEIDGKVVSQPRTVVLEGHKAKLTQVSSGTAPAYSVEVTPTITPDPAVSLAFVIRQTQNGETKVLSRPRTVVLNRATATIEQSTPQSFKLSVTPTYE